MKKEELINRAQELGIQDVESLTTNDMLKDAIAKAEAMLEAKKLGIEVPENCSKEELDELIKKEHFRLELVEKATALGIEGTDKYSSEDLLNIIVATENTNLQARLTVYNEVLGLEGAESLSLEDLAQAIKSKLTVSPEAVDVIEEEVVGKTKKSFKAKNEKEYVFSDDAPAAFRHAGTLRTQEEWIKDSSAMQLMVDGNLPYVKLKTE